MADTIRFHLDGYDYEHILGGKEMWVMRNGITIDSFDYSTGGVYIVSMEELFDHMEDAVDKYWSADEMSE